jgi:hypothetical protein
LASHSAIFLGTSYDRAGKLDVGNTYRLPAGHDHALPTCPKCQKFISESHYQRHLRRCGTDHGHEPQPLHASSAAARRESPDSGVPYGPQSTDQGGTRWRKLMAGFIIFLLIGSVVVFIVLYALSLL